MSTEDLLMWRRENKRTLRRDSLIDADVSLFYFGVRTAQTLDKSYTQKPSASVFKDRNEVYLRQY